MGHARSTVSSSPSGRLCTSRPSDYALSRGSVLRLRWRALSRRSPEPILGRPVACDTSDCCSRGRPATSVVSGVGGRGPDLAAIILLHGDEHGDGLGLQEVQETRGRRRCSASDTWRTSSHRIRVNNMTHARPVDRCGGGGGLHIIIAVVGAESPKVHNAVPWSRVHSKRRRKIHSPDHQQRRASDSELSASQRPVIIAGDRAMLQCSSCCSAARAAMITRGVNTISITAGASVGHQPTGCRGLSPAVVCDDGAEG